MSEETQSNAVDPLDDPNVDTSYPLLQSGRLLTMEIRKPQVVPGKKEGTEVLVIPLYTTDEQTSTKGEALHPGFKCTTRVALTPSGEKYDAQKVAQNLTRWRNATGLAKTVTPRQLKDNPMMMDNARVQVKVGISPEKDGYPESNNFTPVPPE